MKRKDVYKLIDGERKYQCTRWSQEQDKTRSVSDWLIFIEHKLEEAKHDIYYIKHDDALANIRKIAALAVACMEINTTPPRTTIKKLTRQQRKILKEEIAKTLNDPRYHSVVNFDFSDEEFQSLCDEVLAEEKKDA